MPTELLTGDEHRVSKALPRACVPVEEAEVRAVARQIRRVHRFQLLPTLSALENAVLPLDFGRRGSKRGALRACAAQPRAGGARGKVDHLPIEHGQIIGWSETASGRMHAGARVDDWL